MEETKINIKDENTVKVIKHIFDNALNNPVIFDSTPTSAQMKANTIGKVKNAVDYVFVKFPDGKTVKIAVTEVT